MQVHAILSKHLSSVMHKTRLQTLSVLVESLFHAKFFSLTGLGRSLNTQAQERSAIRRVDRFLANKRLQQDRLSIYGTICKLIIGSQKRPFIIVDWSPIPHQNNHVLRAALVTSGRALTLYEEVHPETRLGHPKIHENFLMHLNAMLDKDCRPILITDAGFHSSWFKSVKTLGWDYVGRIRGNKYYRCHTDDAWGAIKTLYPTVTGTPKCLGEIELCKESNFITTLYCYKGRRLGRAAKTKRGKIKQSAQSKKQAKTNQEPWLLVSSLAHTTPEKVIKIYRLRMQIEEGFRDLKSTRYGFGFEHVNTKHLYRLKVFLLLAMLASFLAWLVGWLAENANLHSAYQANSTKHKRVLSLFYLGYRIIRKEAKRIANLFIHAVIKHFPSFHEGLK